MKKVLLTLFSVFLTISVFADFTGDYDVSNWTLTLTNSDGTVNTAGAPGFIEITSGDGGFGPGFTDYTITVPQDTTITFSWAYTTGEDPGWDYPLELINGDSTIFPNFDLGGSDNQGGILSIKVAAGDVFGFRMKTADNAFGRATLTISNFELTMPPPDVVSPIDDITSYIYSTERVLSLFDVVEDANDADTDLTYTIAGNSNPSVVTSSAISSSDGLLTLTFGNIGTAIVTVKVENLSGGFVTEIFRVEVEKYQLTVIAEAQTKIYGEENPELTYSMVGFVDGDDESVIDNLPSYFVNADVASKVDDYTIYPKFDGSDDKYNFVYTYSTLSITPATLTATADSYSRDYGDVNPGFTYSYAGFVNGEDSTVIDTEPSISTLADANSDAGDYEITLAGAMDTNYVFVYIQGTLTVSKIQLTVTANNRLKTYGESNPTFNFNYTGFVNGDDASDIDQDPVLSTDATELSSVGKYDIVVSGGSDNNYNFYYLWGTLTIAKADLTAIADDQSKEYGEANPILTVSYTGFVNDDDAVDIDTPPVAASSANETSIPGIYSITLTGGDDNNYNIFNTDGTLTVNKATLSAVADDKEKNYSDANPALTITYTGFVNGESEGDLDEKPVVSTIADAASEVGNYPITITGGSDSMYDITLTNGTLTVNPIDLEITADNKTKAYGETIPALTYNITGFVAGDDESVLTSAVVISTNANESSDAGVHPINVSNAEATNYKIIFNAGELTITKVTVTATADDISRAYGETNPAFTVSYEGFVNGDDASVIDEDPAGSTTATEISDAGMYDITLSGGSDNNYDFTYVSGTLTIEKTDQTITFGALADVTLGDADFDPDATASSGLEVSYVSSDPAIAVITGDGLIRIVSVGTVTITASQAGNDNYYAAADVNQTLTINDAPDALNSMSITALSVFPNPSEGELTIETSRAGEEIAFRVYDLTGNIVVSSEYELTPYRLFIDMQGVYILQIEKQGVVTIHKIIIE